MIPYSPGLSWVIFLALAVSVMQACIAEHKNRKRGIKGSIPFWASLPGILICAIALSALVSWRIPWQVATAAAVGYCVYVFCATKKASQNS